MTAPAPLRHAIALAATADLGFALGSCLLSFLTHHPRFNGEILVFHDGLPKGDLAALSRLSPRVQLIPLPAADLARRLAARQAGIEAALARCTPYALAKFELFDLLETYDRLVWFDVDLLFRAPVPHLWQQSAPLGWRALPVGGMQRRAAQIAALLPDPPAVLPGFPNAGVLTLCAAPLRAAGVNAELLYALAAESLLHTRNRTPDEMALFLLAARKGLEVASLALADNHPVAQAGSETARILHAIGPDKFWSATPLLQACPDWGAYHRQWQALGGSSTPPARRHRRHHPETPAALLTAARNRAFWEEVWPEIAPDLPPGLWPEMRADRGFLRLHLRGFPGALHLDLAPSSAPGQMQITLGLQGAAPPQASEAPTEALPARLTRIAEAEGLSPSHGKRRLAFSGLCPQEAVAARLTRLTSRLNDEGQDDPR